MIRYNFLVGSRVMLFIIRETIKCMITKSLTGHFNIKREGSLARPLAHVLSSPRVSENVLYIT